MYPADFYCYQLAYCELAMLADQVLADAVLSQAPYLVVLAMANTDVYLYWSVISSCLFWTVLTAVFFVLELLVCSLFCWLPRWELTAEFRPHLREQQGASLAVLGPLDPLPLARCVL